MSDFVFNLNGNLRDDAHQKFGAHFLGVTRYVRKC